MLGGKIVDFETKSDALSCLNPHALLAEGYEEAIIGVVQLVDNSPIVALYDANKLIDVLTRLDGLGDEEAIEFFEFSILGSYSGEHTPAFTPYGYDEEEVEEERLVYRADGVYAPVFIKYFEEADNGEG